MAGILTEDQVREFSNQGFLILKSFYDQEREIRPIQFGIYSIIALLIEKYGLPIEQQPFSSDTFDSGYQQLIGHDRRIGGEVYDAVKQIPAFIRLVSSERHERLVTELRGTDLPGIAAAGYGIRIDNPSEEQYRADWHQDYPGQFRSLDGIVYWSPLMRIDAAIGPLQICIGSHKDGLVPMHTSNPDQPQKTGAYALVMHDKEHRLARYERIEPLVESGDLLLLDFLTIHASGYNHSPRSRWSMQIRYFNFREPTGIRIGWRGSFAAGTNIREIHPELFID